MSMRPYGYFTIGDTVAREPIPDPIDDQLPARKFISSVGDERNVDRRRTSVELPQFDLPARRYWEKALQEDPADYPIF
jgi:hypothetical protein